MKKYRLLVISIAFLISIFSITASAGKKTGISYEQIMRYLSKSMTMKKSTSVRGQPRYMGESDDNLVMMEIIGDKRDITQATLIVGVPNDAPRKLLAWNGAMLMRFVQNATPGWSKSTEWTTAALKKAIDSEQTISTVRGSRKLTVSFQKSLSMIMVTVKAL